MNWDRMVDIAQIVTAVGSVLAGLSAVAVALIVTGREDKRQRESERRAVQRQFVVDLQDAWLTLDRMQSATLEKVQRHQTTSQYAREERHAAFEGGMNREVPDDQATHDARWQAQEARSDEVNRTGEEMTASILTLRDFARHVELLESRIVSDEVKRASLAMRRAIECMVWSVGNVGLHAHNTIREQEYGPAFRSFIDATYDVLADLKPYTPETGETRQLRQAATRIGSNRTWEEASEENKAAPT